MNKKDLDTIKVNSEVDTLVVYHRNSHPGTMTSSINIKYTSGYAKERNSTYHQLVRTLESRMLDHLDLHGSLAGLDVRHMLEQCSVADLHVMRGNSDAGELCKEMIETYDFMNGAPEQSTQTKAHLAMAVSLLSEVKGDNIPSFIDECKAYKGNNLDILLRRFTHENDLYGLNATYSDCYETRSRENAEYRRVSEVINKIEANIFGKEPMPKYSKNNTYLDANGKLVGVFLKQSHQKITEVNRLLAPAEKMQGMLEGVSYTIKDEDNFTSRKTIRDCITTMANIFTYSLIGKELVSASEIKENVERQFAEMSEHIEDSSEFEPVKDLLIRQAVQNIQKRAQVTEYAPA